jgi:UDPglucose--hexose-1-phosphate uridylyltransferase
MTPPANLLYVREKGKIVKLRDAGRRRRSDWLIRCVRNLYPALSQTVGGSSREIGGRFPHIDRKPLGVHEVIIESPRHEDHPHRTHPSQIQLWLEAAIDRMSELGADRRIASFALFRNYGREAGASLAHAHSQLIGTPLVPTRVSQEYEALKAFREKRGSCALCQIATSESKSERRILKTSDFVVIAPWASTFPFEFWIIPTKHSATFSLGDLKQLSRVIWLSFGALAEAVSDPPYNSIFHLAPTQSHGEVFHWHLEAYPKLSIHAGFELGTGTYINTLKPEDAAEALALAVKDRISEL